MANHASNWDPLVLATALPMDYRLRVMGKEELFQNPILAWVIRVGGAFPVNRGGADIQAVKTAIQTIQGGQNLLIFPENHHHPERHRQGRRPASPRPQRRGGDRRPHRRHSGAGVRGWRKADLPPDTHHHRPALYAGIYRPPGDC
ncbi:MAG: lysophospholipid acyltransferase family protein [Dysosmobacter sp.]